VRDVLRLVRAPNLVLAALGVLAGGWIALAAVTTPHVLGFAALAAVGFGVAGNALNDLWDRAADRVNHPAGERPLADGRLAEGMAHGCVVGGTVLGLAAAGLVSGSAVLVGTIALVVMVAYSPVLKRRGLPGNVAVALVAGLPGLDDQPGDQALGRHTLPLVLGPRRTAQLAAALAGGFVPVSLVLPARAHYGIAYFLIALVAQLAVLAVASRLLTGHTAGNSLVLKGAMLVGTVALVAGRVG
jgi:4-hydroxybenzoate polyprenyltransferase